MKWGEFDLHVRWEIDRIFTVAVTNVGVPSPRGELLARKGVIITISPGSLVAAILANIRKRNRDLFALERDFVFVVLRNRVSICVSVQIPPPFPSCFCYHLCRASNSKLAIVKEPTLHT